MSLKELCITNQLTCNSKETRQLVFNRQIRINGLLCNDVNMKLHPNDIVRIKNIEIKIVCHS